MYTYIEQIKCFTAITMYYNIYINLNKQFYSIKSKKQTYI